MKKIFLLSTFILFTITLFNAQNVDIPNTQSPVIIKVSASWCPTCGGWGWNFFEDIYEDNHENSSVFVIHHSGDYTNTAASEITTNFEVPGQPVFLFNGEDLNVSSGNNASKRSSFANKTTENNQLSPDVQTGIDATFKGNELTVNYSTKFFNTLSGDYYIGIYLIEKLVVGYQASRGQNAQHKNILRKELSGNTFGVKFESTSEGGIFNGSILSDITDYDPKNLEIVSIIWKKEGSKFKIINSNIDKDVTETNTSSNQYIKTNINSFEVYPTIFDNNTSIKISTIEYIKKAEINLYNINGRKVLKIYSGNLKKGESKIQFERASNLIAGTYIITLKSESINISRKIIVK